jgi:hypothetical protein
VCHSILNDESFDAIGMRQRHAKTNGATVILHVKRVTREFQCLGEMVHDLRVVIEGIGKLLRIGPVAVSKSRVIGRDQVIAIGKPGEEWLEHSG